MPNGLQNRVRRLGESQEGRARSW